MKSLSSRLRVARRAALIPQVQLAKMLDVSRSAVAQWEREGGSRPTAANLERLSAVLGCSFEWLATGRGHRHVGNRSAEQAETAVILRHFAQDDAEDQLLAVFRTLGAQDQQLVLMVADNLGLRTLRRRAS